MKYVSIIVLQDNFVKSVYTYQKNEVNYAERKFKEIVKNFNDKNSEEDINSCLKDGYYYSLDGVYRVYLSWSINSSEDNKKSKLDYIKKVINEFGSFNTGELELEDSPCLECTSKTSILVDEFYPEEGVVNTYVEDILVDSDTVLYKNMTDEVLDEICLLVENYEADCLQTEKRN